ncbi:hypothetical protein C8R43DRAFT_1170420 [Mycena crocata]|nr:hypothetical protein C8R43DRAFT_1170420 [Mycena crocata]
MHPDLSLAKLSRLPIRQRKLATDAANGSPEALAQVHNLIISSPDTRKRLFLPVLHAILDPAKIPHFDTLDGEIHPRASEAVVRAYIAINALNACEHAVFPPHIIPNLWPRIWQWKEVVINHRIWQWKEVVINHRHCIHPTPVEDTVLLIFSRLSTLLYTGTGKARSLALIETTSGLRVLLTRTLALALSRADLYHLNSIAYFIGEDTLQHDMDEYIEGAGGSFTQLCHLVIKYIDFLVTQKFTDVIFFHLRRITLFLWRLRDKDQRLFTTLLDVGLTRALTAVATLFAMQDAVQFDNLEQGLVYCFHFMTGAMTEKRGARYALDMLKGGILPLLITLGRKNLLPFQAEGVLRQILPNAMMHYAFVAKLKISLAAVTKFSSSITSEDPATSPFLEHWRFFWHYAQETVATLDWYHSPEFLTLQACDNMECGMLAPKFRFRCCGACKTRKYCSRECQSSDWRDDDHRSVCSLLQHLESTPRERGFFRAILHRQYQKIKSQILQAQLEFLILYGGADFYTEFLYDHVPLKVNVLPVDGPLSPGQTPRPSDAAWMDAVSRARRSRGRMEVHLVKIRDGDRQGERILTMRSNSSAIYDGLREMAAKIPQDTNLATLARELATDIAQLMEDTQDVVQIHCE